MSAGVLLFAFCTVVSVAGALATVTAKNPIRGAVGLLATIIGFAALFLKLRAEFLAAIQLIVYAGAVVVLFVFVLMLLGAAATSAAGRDKAKLSRTIGAGVMAVVSVVGVVLLLSGRDGATGLGETAPDHGTVEAVGRLLFTDALVVFELTTALLIVAVIGAIAVARGKQGSVRPRRTIANPQDFFVGELTPPPTPTSLPPPPGGDHEARGKGADVPVTARQEAE